MGKKHVFFLLCFLFVSDAKSNGEAFSGLIYADDYPIAHVEPLEFEKFSMMQREMQYLIFYDGDHSKENHFCVVGYAFENGGTEAVVIWKEDNSLFVWRGGEAEAAKRRFGRAFSLYRATRIGEENLYDKLPDPPYFLGGDKLATRSSFYATMEDCERHGRQYRIPAFTPPDDEDAP